MRGRDTKVKVCSTHLITLRDLKSISLLVLFLYTCIITASCAPRVDKPLHLDPSFDTTLLDYVIVLPAVDIRKDLSVELSEDWYKTSVKGINFYLTTDRYFRRKGYKEISLSYEENYGSVNKITEYDLQDGDPDFIKQLGPDDSKWVLMFVLEDLAIRKTFGKACMAECAAYLFDKDAGRVVWHHENLTELGAGGLLGFFACNAEQMIEACFMDLVYKGFPNRD